MDFDEWFQQELSAGRMQPADESIARPAWRAARSQGIGNWLKLADRAVALRDLHANSKCTADSLKLSIMRLADEADKLITESVRAEIERATR